MRSMSYAHLRTLDLAENPIDALPDAIGDLAELTILYVHRLRLSTLPAAIGRLSRLAYLNASGNRITELPATIGELTALVDLRLDDNELESLPESLGSLTTLRQLHLRGNRLASLPPAVRGLSGLTHLDVRDSAPGPRLHYLGLSALCSIRIPRLRPFGPPLGMTSSHSRVARCTTPFAVRSRSS